MANRQPFSRAVQREIARRAVNAIGEKACEQCGAVGVPIQLHHIDMDALKTAEAKKRKLTADDGQMLCSGCHDPITKQQRVVLAKVEAVEAKHWLPRKEGMIGSRGFAKYQRPRPAMTKVVSRRMLFEEPKP